MSAILVVYQSRFGHSAEIAEHIGVRIRDRGMRATILQVDAARAVNLRLYDAVVVIAPVYFGGHPKAVTKFLRRKRVALAERAFAFVSVANAVANAGPAAATNAARKLQRLVAETGARPDVMTTVAGAISYPRYGVFLRLVMKLHALVVGAPTDTSTVHVLTDWSALDRALAPFLAPFEVPHRTRVAPDESGIHRIIAPNVPAGPAHVGGGTS
jgi:menaquinone-dependent protoporphyrinogen oxidase